MIKRVLVGLLILLPTGYLGLSWFLSNLILFPQSSLDLTKSRMVSKWKTTYEEMMADLPEPQSFSLVSFDETSIKGQYFQQPDTSGCAIILSHGWTSTWAGMLKYVPVLSDCTCDLVLYDHRAHGLSDGKYATGGINEAKDLLAVTDWVREQKGFSNEQIGWLGASWGAATVLMAGADADNVAFIIADAPFQDWYSAIFERGIRDYGSWIQLMSFGVLNVVGWRAGIDFEDASVLKVAHQIEEPVLLIHSKGDRETASHQSVNIAKKIPTDQCSFYHLDWGGDHTEDVRINRDRFQGLINEFLEKVDKRFLKLVEETIPEAANVF